MIVQPPSNDPSIQELVSTISLSVVALTDIALHDSTTFENLARETLASHNNQSIDPCMSNSSTGTTAHTKVDAVAVVGGSLGGALGIVLLGAIMAVLYAKRRSLRKSRRPLVGSIDERPNLGRSPTLPVDVRTDLITTYLRTDQSSGVPLSWETSRESHIGPMRLG